MAGAKLRHGCCSERASPQLRRHSAAVVGWQSAGSVGKSRSQSVRPIAAAASSSGSRGEQNTAMDVVPELRDPVQARTERNAEEYGEFGAGAPAQSAAGGREEDDEFQRPRRVRFHDEQMYPISKEEREEHELLGHVQYRSWCRHCAAARGVGQQHRQLRDYPVDATVPEIVLDYYFMGEESETAPHIEVKDRKSSAYFSTSLDSKTSQYAVAFVAGAIQEARVQKDFDEERQRASHQTIERKSFGMFARCGVCTQRSACRRQSCKWFGRECRETGERPIQDTQIFDRGPVQLQN